MILETKLTSHRSHLRYSEPTARQVARVCLRRDHPSEKGRGLQEIANMLGRKASTLSSPIATMLDRRELNTDVEWPRPDGKRTLERQALYWVTEEQLAEAESRGDQGV